MTKERKAAIEQWQTIKKETIMTPFAALIKPTTPYAWDYNCWFCHYLRDYDHENGNDDLVYKGCKRCPLNKWAVSKGVIKKYNEFGCTHRHKTIYHIVCNPKYSLEERLEACDLIIRALKGEHIWED